MRNGLTLTVPAGWAGTRSTYRAPGARVGVHGDIISEAVQLRRTDGKTTAPSTVLLYSRITSATAAPERREFILMLSASGLRLFSIGYLPSPDSRLFAAETSAPGAQQGVAYFDGLGSDPRGSLERVWNLLHVSGVVVPARK